MKRTIPPKEKSNYDINLRAGIKDEEYLDILKESSTFRKDKSDIIFFQAGVDTLYSDNLGHLLLSRDGLKNENVVLDFAKKN